MVSNMKIKRVVIFLIALIVLVFCVSSQVIEIVPSGTVYRTSTLYGNCSTTSIHNQTWYLNGTSYGTLESSGFLKDSLSSRTKSPQIANNCGSSSGCDKIDSHNPAIQLRNGTIMVSGTSGVDLGVPYGVLPIVVGYWLCDVNNMSNCGQSFGMILNYSVALGSMPITVESSNGRIVSAYVRIDYDLSYKIGFTICDKNMQNCENIIQNGYRQYFKGWLSLN